MVFETSPVVLDNGGYCIKAGFACDNHPVAMFRTLVGRPNCLHGRYGREYYDVFIGDDAMKNIEDLEPSRPIVNGKIVHWDNMERIWHHVFYKELRAAPDDRAVVLACGPTANMKEKIKCCEIFFETLNSPALCVRAQCALAMYGSGSTTGICIDMGHDTINVIPIFEGGIIRYAHMNSSLAGAEIENYIKKCFCERNLTQNINTCDIECIKKKYLYITNNCSVTRKEYMRKYKLPDGKVIDISDEAFMASELIFQPDLVIGENTEYIPLHEAVLTASLKCDDELRKDLFDAIVPCGGLSTIPGFNERLAVEITNKIYHPISILSSSESYAVAWLGGATFANLSDAQKMWLQKEQFEDHGEKIVRKKFL